jgi:hypothetical protein
VINVGGKVVVPRRCRRGSAGDHIVDRTAERARGDGPGQFRGNRSAQARDVIGADELADLGVVAGEVLLLHQRGEEFRQLRKLAVDTVVRELHVNQWRVAYHVGDDDVETCVGVGGEEPQGGFGIGDGPVL